MKKYPALAYELKDKPGNYIERFSPDTTTNLEDAFLFVNQDGRKPIKKEIIKYAKEIEKDYREQMEKRFGKNAIINFKPYKWLQVCNLVEVEISEETFHLVLEEE
ncbi:hypothetical protein MTW84_00750 [Mammaliicoccus sciuri]|uniref:hypothetical protein n=1 Tax=Mammaliicoccus sciuri TaxID=1296 RepID=UPI001FB2D748|nr:hypothetical protein [Mammaliicoccus sciuri]MCJ0907722.1 hypothetical protein [Mammaliicoccus sciuri]